MSVDRDSIYEILDEHLNTGCVDDRCWFTINPNEDFPDHFHERFIEHLTELVVEACS